jgi:copper(I)-binding protein
MKKNLFHLVLLSILVSLGLTACDSADDAGQPQATEPELRDAWVRAISPGMQMSAAYGVLVNTTPTELVLDAFSSDVFGSVSLHRTELVDGVSQMREVEGYTLAPGDSLEMAPGGYHLMLMRPVAFPSVGHKIRLHISTRDGRRFSFEVPVERR